MNQDINLYRKSKESGNIKKMKNKFEKYLHFNTLFKNETMLAFRITSVEGQQHESDGIENSENIRRVLQETHTDVLVAFSPPLPPLCP